jgi:hypothetical protein
MWLAGYSLPPADSCVVQASNRQEVRQVRSRVGILSLALAFGVSAYGQSQSGATPNQGTNQSTAQNQGRSAGGDIGSGSGDIGAEEVGKGVGSAGKNVGVGTAKGTGKIVKGTGRLLKKPF